MNRSHRGSTALALLAVLAISPVVASACRGAARNPEPEDDVFRATPTNQGEEPYSAWFADSDGRIVYFGLSPFWELWWRTKGDPHADLKQPGDHLIGRFDLDRQRFLEPLRVRKAGEDSRSSVWDVLVHSNGRVYYTTYFEELGEVDLATQRVRYFDGLGSGFNELVEGPGGRIYITRYSDAPRDASQQRYGGLVVITPEGELIQEVRFEQSDGSFTAPKSVAVDPASGEIWLNADLFRSDGSVGFRRLRISEAGEVLEQRDGLPELLIMGFDSRGRGVFVEDTSDGLQLALRRNGRESQRIALGPRAASDYAQDIHFAPDGSAVIAFWSGRVVVLDEREDEPRVTSLQMPRPAECTPPRGRSLFYSAFVRDDWVWATLFCGATLVRARLPGRPISE